MRVSGCALVRTPPCVRVGVPWACVPPEVYGAVGGGGVPSGVYVCMCRGARTQVCTGVCAGACPRGRVPARPRASPGAGARGRSPRRGSGCRCRCFTPCRPVPPPRPAAGRRGGDETPSGFRRAPPGLGAGAGRGDGRPRRPQLLVRLVRRRPGEGEPRRPLLRPRGCGSGAVGAGRCPRRPWGGGRGGVRAERRPLSPRRRSCRCPWSTSCRGWPGDPGPSSSSASWASGMPVSGAGGRLPLPPSACLFSQCRSELYSGCRWVLTP